MRNIKIIMLFVCLLLLVDVSASSSQSPGQYDVNEDAYLIQTCDNCTYVNITHILLGDRKTNITLNVAMDGVDGFYSYLLNKSYITLPGTYTVSGSADPDGVFTRWNYDIKVSPLAIEQSVSQAIGSAMFLFLMVALMLIFGWIGFKLFKSSNWWIAGIFFVFFSSLLLVYNTWLGFQYHRLFTGLPDSAVPERLFWILLIIIMVGFFVSMALLFLKWKEVLRYVKREIKRKESKDEDLEDWDIDRWGGEDFGRRGR